MKSLFRTIPMMVAATIGLASAMPASAQFAKPASRWPDPNSTTEGINRLQTAFWNVALTGEDQLRQRLSFALSQILVVSGVENRQFQQMANRRQRHSNNYE